MMRDSFLFRTRDNEEYSRSSSREREKREMSSRQFIRSPNYGGCKLHVGRIPLQISEEYVKMQFEKFGKVEEVRIMRKDTNGQPLMGFLYGFVTMVDKDEARRALDEVNQNTRLGWSVSYSKEKPNSDSPRSPQRSQRVRNRFSEDMSEDRKFEQNFLNRDNENVDYSLEPDYLNEIKLSPDNPDDFISYNHETTEPTPNSNKALLGSLCSNWGTDNPQKAADLMKVLQLPPEKLVQLTSSIERNRLNGFPILVRELWLGNLSQNLEEAELRNEIKTVGDIENIEYHIKPNTRFAFVKFKTVRQASKASEAVQYIRCLLNSPNLKIAFSDHQRRKNVVGNALDCEDTKDEELTSILYLGFSTGTTIANEVAVREVLSTYGQVVNVSINQMPKQNNSKSYALVEMAFKEQAKHIRQRITPEDRMRLGDRNCEMCILAKSKIKDSFFSPSHEESQVAENEEQSDLQLPLTTTFPQRMNSPYVPQNMPFPGCMPKNFEQPEFNGCGNFRDPMMFQNPHRNHFQQHPFHRPHNFFGFEGPENPNHFMHPHGMPGGMPMVNRGFPMDPYMNNHFPNHPINPNFGGPCGFGPNFPPNQFHSFHPNPQFNPAFAPNMFPNFEEARKMNNFDSNVPSQVASTTVSSNSKSPKERAFFEGNDSNPEVQWSGFIVKSKQTRIGVDASLVEGDGSILLNCYSLNISHRITYDEIPNRKIKAIMVFNPSEESYTESFNGLISYFLEKDRAGFVSFDQYNLYLLPPCNKSFKFHQFENNELLGIFFDTKDAQSQPIDDKVNRRNYETMLSKESNDDFEDLDEVMSILKNADFEKLLA